MSNREPLYYHDIRQLCDQLKHNFTDTNPMHSVLRFARKSKADLQVLEVPNKLPAFCDCSKSHSVAAFILFVTGFRNL